MLTSGDQKIEKGWLSNVAGKAFSVLAVGALIVPLLGIGQGFGIVPGKVYSNSYVDVGSKIEQVIESVSPAEQLPDGVIALQPVDGTIREYYSGPHLPNAFDTDISMTEGLAALGTAAIAGGAGIAIGGIDRRRVEKANETVTQEIQERRNELYASAKDRYIAGLPDAYDNAREQLSTADLGRLVAMGNADLDKLPDWMRAQAYLAQRDIALAALHHNDLQDETDISLQDDFKYASMDSAAQAEIFKLQRDQAWKVVNHELEMESAVAQSNSRAFTAGAGGFSLGMMTGNKNAAAGVGMVILMAAAVAAVGVPSYLTGKAVHENFFRAFPEELKFEEPGVPALLSAEDELTAARDKLAGIRRYGTQAAASSGAPAVAPA